MHAGGSREQDIRYLLIVDNETTYGRHAEHEADSVLGLWRWT